MGKVKMLGIGLLGIGLGAGIWYGAQLKRHGALLDSVKEFPRVISDWVSDNSYQRREGRTFLDLQVHLHKLNHYSKGVESLIDTAIEQNVDVVAVCDYGAVPGSEGDNILKFSNVTQALSQLRGYKNIKWDPLMALVMREDGEEVYFLKGQEIETKQGRDLVVLGCETNFGEGEDLETVLRIAEEEQGITFVPHPFSMARPVVGFWYPSEQEMETLNGLVGGVDGIEVFNSKNTLWMYPSNLMARNFARSNGMREIAS